MLTGSITFTGKTLSDVEAAVSEALRRIGEDFTSGHDRNETSSFAFTVEGDEEEQDC